MADIKTIEERIASKAESEQQKAEGKAREAIRAAVRMGTGKHPSDYLDCGDVRLFVAGHFKMNGDADVGEKLNAMRAQATERRAGEHRSELLNTIRQLGDFLDSNA